MENARGLGVHGRGDGVARVGPVQGDPGHAVLDTAKDGILRGPPACVGGHQTRWMMFMREVHTGSPVVVSVHAVSTTTKVMVLPFDSFW